MKHLTLLLLVLAVATPLLAQVDPPLEETFLLRHVSGTTPNPGTRVPYVVSNDGTSPWVFFHAFSANVSYVSESGPEDQRNEVFSTNWFTGGLHGRIGDRTTFVLRGRVSLEPYTIKEEGYPQILQFVSPEGGDVLIDHMRPHDLFGEAGGELAFRLGTNSFLHVYAAAVGDPALGAPPAELRASGIDFAEAPFAYDVQETFYSKTRVVTAGYSSKVLSLEASMFHDSISTGDHTEFDDGDFDSQSVRLTLMPTPNMSVQVSRGELGEDELTKRDITSASLGYATNNIAATALWTRRERENRPAVTSMGFELAVRAARSTVMARVESVDRPQDLFLDQDPFDIAVERTSHFTVGYLFDVVNSNRYRAGAGVNIDYHTNTHELEDSALYGHKPQSIYAFLRFRTK
jgi:hypothetical protein